MLNTTCVYIWQIICRVAQLHFCKYLQSLRSCLRAIQEEQREVIELVICWSLTSPACPGRCPLSEVCCGGEKLTGFSTGGSQLGQVLPSSCLHVLMEIACWSNSDQTRLCIGSHQQTPGLIGPEKTRWRTPGWLVGTARLNSQVQTVA